jgi:hypothetical protein
VAVLAYDIVPFQLVYVTNDEPAEMMSMNTHTDMTILQVTRNHVIDRELRLRKGYDSLTLYQTIRPNSGGSGGSSATDPVPFVNGTQIAFTGSVKYFHFQTAASSSNSTRSTNESTRVEDVVGGDAPSMDLYTCFLGTNATQYVDLLRLYGWKSLMAVEVMTMGGVVMLSSGSGEHTTNVTNEQPINNIRTTSAYTGQMDQRLSTIFYVAASLLPLTILAVMATVCLLIRGRERRSSSEHTFQFKTTIDPTDWQDNSEKARRLQRWALGSHGNNSSCASGSALPPSPMGAFGNKHDKKAQSASDSVVVAIEAKTAERHRPIPLRSATNTATKHHRAADTR